MESKTRARLAGRVAIVTGGSRGIGAGLVLELARHGAKVAITYTSPSSEPGLNKLMEQIKSFGNGSDAVAIKRDLRDPASPGHIVAETIRNFGSDIDILVNNAGKELVRRLEDVTVEDFSSIYDLNVRAPMLMLQAVLPHLRAPGRIINIGSVGGRHGFKELSVYCSSKAALEGLTRCWAAELGSAGHTVNTVNPGPVKTDLYENIPSEIVEKQKADTPIENRVATVEDIALVVLLLASDESRWITGQTISASGGWAMY
ncbi:hypothetical protein BDW74DRAFT_162654 [Aspergillus multicolor]|uniref:SDR family NAD(P)-dependent oxidoreductase n=1 Tax=Aspergillus multicolor TaxID=41759 RepID=UPI003CCDB0EA